MLHDYHLRQIDSKSLILQTSVWTQLFTRGPGIKCKLGNEVYQNSWEVDTFNEELFSSHFMYQLLVVY